MDPASCFLGWSQEPETQGLREVRWPAWGQVLLQKSPAAPTPSSQSWLEVSHYFKLNLFIQKLSKPLLLIKPKLQTRITVIPYKTSHRETLVALVLISHLDNKIFSHKPHFLFPACSNVNLDLLFLSIIHNIHVCKLGALFIT